MLGNLSGNNYWGDYFATPTMIVSILKEAPILVCSEPDGVEVEIDIINKKNVPVEILQSNNTIGLYTQVGVFTMNEFPKKIITTGQNPKFKARWKVEHLISKDSAYVYVLSEIDGFVYIMFDGEYITVDGSRLIIEEKLL